MKSTRINIAALAKGKKQHSLVVDDYFFNKYPVNKVDTSAHCDKCCVDCMIEKSKTLIKIEFTMSMTFTFVCDVTCNKFQETIVKKDYIVVKYNTDRVKSVEKVYPNNDDKIMYINQGATFIDLSQTFYDIIVTSIPMKKIDFSIHKDSINDGNKYIYQTTNENNKDMVKEPIDERFSTLKKLLNK